MKRNILVTGGTRGLGFAVVKRLVSDGYHVIATARSISGEMESLMRQDNHPGLVSFYPYDFTDTKDIHDFVKMVVAETGNLYGLVNNAALGYDGVLATMHDSQIEELLKVNVLSPVLLTKYVVRNMILQKSGRIINIASIIANTGFNGLSVYGASKAALVGFTKSLARELGKANITVNSIAPGFLTTGMTRSLQGDKLDAIKRRSPLNRLADVNDVAHAVSFLVSEGASSITGTTITVDAGSTS
ncbi:MAG: SDR family oxidoreductase [Deltaproteobacteria bacterium]|nr:SDR family oxidoreductase [Deltaproteobacteria bacterium]TLN01173.1 MAG: SDR family oxidoreductase [bacterium]